VRCLANSWTVIYLPSDVASVLSIIYSYFFFHVTNSSSRSLQGRCTSHIVGGAYWHGCVSGEVLLVYGLGAGMDYRRLFGLCTLGFFEYRMGYVVFSDTRNRLRQVWCQQPR